MNQCKRLSDCPADRLAQCRGKVVQAAESSQWKMVPVIATEEMIRFANVAVPKTPNAQWNAMLAAAPVPPAGDVEGLMISLKDHKIGQAALLEHIESLKADRTRLTAERDGLLGKLADNEECYRSAAQRADLYGEELKSTSDELTKARELIRANATDFEGIRRALASFHKENQEQWCGYLDDSLGICLFRIKEMAAYLATPIAHNVDESCGQDAEADRNCEWEDTFGPDYTGEDADAAKCALCEASTVESCDEKGCGFLGAGNGAPAAKGEHCDTCSKLNGSSYCDCDQGGV